MSLLTLFLRLFSQTIFPLPSIYHLDCHLERVYSELLTYVCCKLDPTLVLGKGEWGVGWEKEREGEERKIEVRREAKRLWEMGGGEKRERKASTM